MNQDSFNINNELKSEISLLEGLRNDFDLIKLILNDNKPQFLKTSVSISREFDCDKWGKLFDYFKTNNVKSLKDIEKLEDGNRKKHFYIHNKHYRVRPCFFRDFMKYNLVFNIRNYLKQNNYSAIIELGCGYGSKILSLAKEISNLHSGEYIGVDISKNGLKLAKKLANLESLNLKTEIFDYRKNKFSDLKIPKNSLLFTNYAIHYSKNFTYENINEFINSGIKTGIHFEPCSELNIKIENEIYAGLCQKYLLFNDYTQNIYTAFKEAERLGIIKLDKIDKPCGAGLLPATMIKWRASN